ncbi:nucleic acid-binding [Striga asiatica]|uniref:Nucleic acid-binding n=1 Tax=Striga asiatica TaxID=4170 RepID=A0A5A7P2N8_STRAF|nr:nucleic acid-binding [Striga asiatica]
MDNTEWKIKVRVVRCCEATTLDHSTVLGVGVIFHDSEGYRVHASLFRRHLDEKSVVAIRDFIVAPNYGRYKTTIGRYEIIFMTHSESPKIGSKNSSTISRALLSWLKKPFSTSYIIGRVNNAFCEITLKDIDRNKIYLWEEKIDEILPSILNREIEPLVLILQFCRVKVVGVTVFQTPLISQRDNEVAENENLFKSRMKLMMRQMPILKMFEVAMLDPIDFLTFFSPIATSTRPAQTTAANDDPVITSAVNRTTNFSRGQ